MGLVVDYIGIKSNMNIALAKYSKVDANDFEDINKAVIIVKDQLDLLSKLFHQFDINCLFPGNTFAAVRMSESWSGICTAHR